MKLIGKRIRKRRESMGLHLSELSKRVGVSSSALSQIENAKAFPTIITLKAIADNLHTTVSELIGEHEAFPGNPLVKYDQKKYVKQNASGTSLFLLAENIEPKQMDTELLVFPEGADSEEMVSAHHGQTYLFLIKGELLVCLDEQSYLLKKNDSMYFNAHMNFTAVNKSKRESHLLVVNTPPVK